MAIARRNDTDILGVISDGIWFGSSGYLGKEIMIHALHEMCVAVGGLAAAEGPGYAEALAALRKAAEVVCAMPAERNVLSRGRATEVLLKGAYLRIVGPEFDEDEDA